MIDGMLAVALVGLFTFGCVVIHALRGHASRVTPVLVLVVLSLGPFTGLVALALTGTDRTPSDAVQALRTPAQDRRDAPDPSTSYGFD